MNEINQKEKVIELSPAVCITSRTEYSNAAVQVFNPWANFDAC